MTDKIYDKIRHLIKATDDAYISYDTANADYAEFASLALGDFQKALSKPSMTNIELRVLIRSAFRKLGTGRQNKDWHNFVADYISRSSNESALAIDLPTMKMAHSTSSTVQ